MKLGELLKSVGKGLVSATPYGKVALDIVSAVTGRDPDENMTGDQALAEIDALPPAQKEKILIARLNADVEHDREFTKRFETMNQNSGWSWLRPFIVLQFSMLVTGTSLYFLYLLQLTIQSAIDDNPAQSVGASIGLAVTAVAGLWPMVLAVQSLPTAIIRSWFGFREQAKRRAAAIANGEPTPQFGGVLEGIKNLLK